MGNYNDFDLDIKKVQGENDIGPASITTTIILRLIIRYRDGQRKKKASIPHSFLQKKRLPIVKNLHHAIPIRFAAWKRLQLLCQGKRLPTVHGKGQLHLHGAHPPVKSPPKVRLLTGIQNQESHIYFPPHQLCAFLFELPFHLIIPVFRFLFPMPPLQIPCVE